MYRTGRPWGIGKRGLVLFLTLRLSGNLGKAQIMLRANVS